MKRWYLNLLILPLLQDANPTSRYVICDATNVYQFFKSLVFQAESILTILELLLAPIVAGVGVKLVNQCLPSTFGELLPISMSIGDDGLIGSDENVRLIVISLYMLTGPQLTDNLLGVGCRGVRVISWLL